MKSSEWPFGGQRTLHLGRRYIRARRIRQAMRLNQSGGPVLPKDLASLSISQAVLPDIQVAQ